MQEINGNKSEEKKKMIIYLYKQIRKGCQRKICYNIYCYNNLLCKESN